MQRWGVKIRGLVQHEIILYVQLNSLRQRGPTGMDQALRTYPKAKAMEQLESELTVDDC